MSDLQLIGDSSPFEEGRTPCPQGGEDRWSARWLMTKMGYDNWQNFEQVIERAKTAAHNQGFNVRTLFTAISKKGQGRPQTDYNLTRFAAYLVAMNGDPRKPEVAAAQAYFAVRTREAETAVAPFSIPQNYAEALRAAADQAERAELAEAKILTLDAKIADDAPKVNYINVYVADADLLSFSTVASSNGVKESQLRDLLIAKDWIYMQSDSRWSDKAGKKVIRNRYSEKSDKKRYFRRVEVHEAPRFRGSEVMHTLKITPAGAEAVARLIAKAVD